MLPQTKGGEHGFFPTSSSATLWETLGKIIHHREFKVFKDDAEVKKLLGQFDGDILAHYQALVSAKDIAAACYLKSDKGEPIIFQLSDFVRLTAEFLQKTENFLADHEIYVGGYAVE